MDAVALGHLLTFVVVDLELISAEICKSKLLLSSFWGLAHHNSTVKDQFDDYRESTIGAAFLTQTISLDENTTIKFEIWDTAGQERYKSLAPMYYRNANCAVVVYDITQAVCRPSTPSGLLALVLENVGSYKFANRLSGG